MVSVKPVIMPVQFVIVEAVMIAQNVLSTSYNSTKSHVLVNARLVISATMYPVFFVIHHVQLASMQHNASLVHQISLCKELLVYQNVTMDTSTIKTYVKSVPRDANHAPVLLFVLLVMMLFFLVHKSYVFQGALMDFI